MDVVATYIARHVMPADPAGDALHLALASFHRSLSQSRGLDPFGEQVILYCLDTRTR